MLVATTLTNPNGAKQPNNFCLQLSGRQWPPVQLEEATNGGNYNRESNGNKGSNIECDESEARVKGMDECKEPVRSGSEEPLPPQGRSWNKAQGVFVENYPNPLAGAPVSDKKQDPPDLVAYMRDCGPLGDPTVLKQPKY
ncbi:hypothetical protein RHS01_10891 [Rhizoctonia solani]|uniref:Uncharacterized protein n=1 Tax=Rhizoctonia solani TaxID=456999 RepID=A0A8H7LZM2_9AGAM|nr:hypothetical protein RHS01_10891 [Rhizoctonia solani]